MIAEPRNQSDPPVRPRKLGNSEKRAYPFLFRTQTSVQGQMCRFRDVHRMPGLPQTADIAGSGRHFAFGPSTDEVRSQSPQLFLDPQQTSRTRSLTFMNGWIGTFGVAILEVGSCPLPVPCLEVILDSTPAHRRGDTRSVRHSTRTAILRHHSLDFRLILARG